MADAKKTAYIREITRTIQEIDTIFDNLEDLKKEYTDLGYAPAGANPIVDADLAAYNLTADNMTAGVTLLQQMINLATGAAVTVADYSATSNIFKRAPV